MPLLTNQLRYSILNLERELDGTIDTCLELGVTPVAHSPLAGGVATTRFAKGGGQRAAAWREVARGRALYRWPPPASQLPALVPTYQALTAVAEAGRGAGRTETQVALQFVMAKGVIPLPGVTTAAEAAEVAGTLKWELGLGELAALNEAARGLHVRRADIPWLREL